MTIEEIKSVSIVQFLESQGYHHVYILKENYWYLSPFRTEASPSFNVSPKKNLWNDFGAGEGCHGVRAAGGLQKDLPT